jgi:hypothetical protein
MSQTTIDIYCFVDMILLRLHITPSPYYSSLSSVHLWQLVCPGTWLCDLTLERYEVREKKVSKKVSWIGLVTC